MGRIEDFLDNEFKRCVHMYVGNPDYRCVRYWISGFDSAISQAFPNETGDLVGFKEWLLVHMGGTCTVGWQGIISEKYGDGPDATHRFLDLFREFRADVNSRGLKAILKEHYDFEIESYGAPRVSEYFSKGWDKRSD